MTHEEMISIIRAHMDGKSIEFRRTDGNYPQEWTLCDDVKWNFGACDYRVKPEPQYRPHKDADEFWYAVQEHGSWIRTKDFTRLVQVHDIYDRGCLIFTVMLTYNELFERYVWADDGSPCGVKEE